MISTILSVPRGMTHGFTGAPSESRASKTFYEILEPLHQGKRLIQSDLNTLNRLIDQSPNLETLLEYGSLLKSVENTLESVKIQVLQAKVTSVAEGFEDER